MYQLRPTKKYAIKRTWIGGNAFFLQFRDNTTDQLMRQGTIAQCIKVRGATKFDNRFQADRRCITSQYFSDEPYEIRKGDM